MMKQNLYIVTWRERGKAQQGNFSQFCLAPSAGNATKMPHFFDDTSPINRTVKARLIKSEAEIGVAPDLYKTCFVENWRDYALLEYREQPYGKFLDSRWGAEVTLIQDLREQWRQEENQRMENRLQLRFSFRVCGRREKQAI